MYSTLLWMIKSAFESPFPRHFQRGFAVPFFVYKTWLAFDAKHKKTTSHHANGFERVCIEGFSICEGFKKGLQSV